MNKTNDTEEGENPSSDLPKNRGWISLRQLATLMEKSYHTVMHWRRDGMIRYIKVGGEYRILEEEVRYILENGTRPAGTVDTSGD